MSSLAFEMVRHCCHLLGRRCRTCVRLQVLASVLLICLLAVAQGSINGYLATAQSGKNLKLAS
jgi:hypothetical protein